VRWAHAEEQEQDGAEATARKAPPEPPSPAEHVLALQRTAGNQAVGRMLQRLRAKPGTPKGSKSELDDLESAVDKDNAVKAAAASLALYNADPAHFEGVILYKLDKHRGAAKFDRYLGSIPQAAQPAILIETLRTRDKQWIPKMAWMARNFPAQWDPMAKAAPDLFIEHVIRPLRDEVSPATAVRMLEDKNVLNALRYGAPAAYAKLADETPQLGMGEDAYHMAGPGANERQIVDQIFRAIIGNRADPRLDPERRAHAAAEHRTCARRAGAALRRQLQGRRRRLHGPDLLLG
jgi:hypothetical protein